MKLIPIHPQGDLFNLSAVARAVTSTLIEATGDARSDLQKTTASWKHKVDFAISPIEGGFQVDTGDKIWKYVDEGTRAHIITPKHGKVLSFGPGSRRRAQRAGPRSSRTGSTTPAPTRVSLPRRCKRNGTLSYQSGSAPRSAVCWEGRRGWTRRHGSRSNHSTAFCYRRSCSLRGC
jgi:uncharacterized membrane protein